jgi:hypothetical protein
MFKTEDLLPELFFNNDPDKKSTEKSLILNTTINFI